MNKFFYFSTLLLFLLSGTIIAQEVLCADGIDNDLDGLIDNNDPDCSCSGPPVGYPNFVPQGSASFTGTQGCGECYRLTSSSTYQSGQIWANSMINYNQPFDLVYELYFGSNDGGADGICFTMHKDPRGRNAVGGRGAGLGSGHFRPGCYGSSSTNLDGLSPSLIVEMDTWRNTECSNTWDGISQDHIMVYKNGDYTSSGGQRLTNEYPLSNIEDGSHHRLRVTWDPVLDSLHVYFDNLSNPIFRINLDITTIFGNDSLVYWGFSAGTGVATNEHKVCATRLDANLIFLPVEYSHLDAKLINEKEIAINWSTISEEDNKGFNIEWSRDGINFVEIGFVPGLANSYGSITEYSYIMEDSGTKENYLRIKQTNFDGTFSYSEILYVEKPILEINERIQIFFNNDFNSGLNLSLIGTFNGDVEISVFNSLGQIIYNSNTIILEKDMMKNYSMPLNLSSGTYYVTVKSPQLKLLKTQILLLP